METAALDTTTKIFWAKFLGGTADVLEIAWPSGAKQTLRDVAVDQTVVVVEPSP